MTTGSTIPPFDVSQSPTHVTLHVRSEACPPSCSPKVVVDGGSIFGLACSHFHLPLVFPPNTLVDGHLALAQNGLLGSSSIELERGKDFMVVNLQKRREGESLPGLEDIKPSVFPLLEEDAEGQHEERMLGLAILQQGREAMNKSQITSQSAIPSLPHVPKMTPNTNTKVHEYFGQAGDGHEARKAAAYSAEERHWDEGMYLDSFVDEDGEVDHLCKASVTPATVGEEGELLLSDHPAESCDQAEDFSLLLLELLLAQAYDQRMTLGDSTVESAWTIAVLSRALVAGYLPSSQRGDSVSTVLIGSMRRQLTYPLYRSWALSIKVASDVVGLLRRGRCLGALLTTSRLMAEAEDEALPLYQTEVIDPLVHLVESSFSQNTLTRLAEALETALASITKREVGGEWNLEELEIAAEEALREGSGGYV